MFLIQYFVFISVHILFIFLWSTLGVLWQWSVMRCYISGNKHRSEFQFLVDQVNNRWKKSGKRKTESAQNKEEVTVKELPAATG